MRRFCISVFTCLAVLVLMSACSGSAPATYQPVVQILAPSYGAGFGDGQIISVQAVSSDTNGVVRVELYVDGQLANTKLAPNLQGEKQFTSMQEWAATSPGAHILVVRAFNAANGSGEATIPIAINSRVALQPTNTVGAAATPQTIIVTATPRPNSTPTNTTMTLEATAPPDAFQPGFPIITATPPPDAFQALFTPTTSPAEATYTAAERATSVAQRATEVAPRQATSLACAHQTSIAPSTWHVLVCDPFDSNLNDWDDYHTGIGFGSLHQQMSKGTYRWDVAKPIEVVNQYSTIPYMLSYDLDLQDVLAKDFYLTAEGKLTSGAQSGGNYGLLFREEFGDYYVFLIAENKQFGVYLRYDGEWTELIRWTDSSAIRPDQANRLTVLAQGSLYAFFINEEKVGEMENNQLTGSNVGMAIGFNSVENASFEFDNFELRAPPPNPEPTSISSEHSEGIEE